MERWKSEKGGWWWCKEGIGIVVSERLADTLFTTINGAPLRALILYDFRFQMVGSTLHNLHFHHPFEHTDKPRGLVPLAADLPGPKAQCLPAWRKIKDPATWPNRNVTMTTIPNYEPPPMIMSCLVGSTRHSLHLTSPFL